MCKEALIEILRWIPVLLGIGLLGGCADPPTGVREGPVPVSEEPEDPLAASGSLVLSEPVQRSRSGLAGLSGVELQGTEPVAYVAFPAGTFSDADRVAILNTVTATAVEGPIIDGGLDPVAVPAAEGDTLEVTVYQMARPLIRLRRPVPRRRPPVIIRTRPANGETAVPLNSSVVVVFSEPIDVETARSGLTLRAHGEEIQVDLSSGQGRVSLEVQPRVSLMRGTEYRFMISREIADLSGDRLEEEKEVRFETEGDAGDPIPSIRILPDTTYIGVGLWAALAVSDDSGATLSPSTVAWESLNPDVAQVYEDGSLHGLAEGSTMVVATAGSLVDTAYVVVAQHAGFKSISAGFAHTCSLTSEGEARCWGSNEWGQLGVDPSTFNSTAPLTVDTDLRFQAISAGHSHTCAIDMDSRIWCWGGNGRRQLGLPTATGVEGLVQVASSERFLHVSAGDWHTCALDISGYAWCWGSNTWGQLGIGTTEAAMIPQPVQGNLVFRSIEAGAGTTCAVATDGNGYCWGDNGAGQLSDMSIRWHSTVPVSPAEVDPDVVGIATGRTHTCRWWADGSQMCSGRSVVEAIEADGQRSVLICSGGRESCPWTLLPVFPESQTYLTATAGYDHGCSLTAEGAIYCWGSAQYGQRGDGRTSTVWRYLSPDPEPVSTRSFSAVDAGAWHTCAVSTSGEAYCWGRNDSGQLGVGGHTSRAEPVRVNY